MFQGLFSNPDTNQAGMTPQQVQQQQQMAQALMQQGSSTAPIQSKWQGVARLADGLLGGLQYRSAQQQDAAGRANNMALMAKLLGGDSAPLASPQNQALAAALDPSSAPSPAQGGGGLPTFAGLGAPKGSLPGDLAQQASADETKYGLPAGYLTRTAGIESGFNPNALNKGSGAAGLYQFVPSTAKAYGLTDPMNPAASVDAAASLASDNAAVLRRTLGREPTAGELYLAHQQGAGGAAKLLSNPDVPASSIVGANAVQSNGGRPDMTAGQFAGMWTGKFGPLATGVPPSQPVRVASLDPNFAPSGGAMPAATAVTGSPAAPAAPTAPAPSTPYGSQPLNIGGKMLTRQQAEDTDGLDHTDYDKVAQAQGMTPTAFSDAPAAPPASSSVVTGSAVPGAPAAPAALPGAPAPAAQSGGIDRAALIAYMNDPYTSPAMQQVAGQMLAAQMKPRETFSTFTDKDGSIWQQNALTGERKLVQDNSKETSDWKVVENGGAPIEYNSKTGETRAVQGLGAVYRPATAEEKATTGAAYIGPGGKPVFAPASTNVTVGGSEKASEAAYGKAEGDEFGNILKAGQAARATQGQLALMQDAFSQANGQISTGPFAKSILGAKQAIMNTTGIDLGGIPETEAVQKLGFGLATSLTKEISQRPAQQEFLKALENVPGIFMSPQGSKVMMSVLNQQAQQKVDLARLVSNPDNRKNWPDVEQAYYEAHPLMSPFTGKPLSAGDVSTLAGAAQQAGFDPATGRQAGAPAPPTAAEAPPMQGARKAPDGSWYVPDPNRAGKYLKVQ